MTHPFKTCALSLILLFVNSAFAANVNHCQATLAKLKDIPANTKQVLLVMPQRDFYARMLLCQKHSETWQSALYQKPFAAVIGKNGVTIPGEKREGDLKTPTGFYPIGEAFGNKPLALKMDYRFLTTEDKFVDDTKSPQYNSWVVGKTDAKSYEPMLIEPYELGAVLNYNMNPAIPGKGSAIFLHLWRNKHRPTAGCVATDRNHLLATLKWLDKKAQPCIYIMPPSEIF
jgi:L,D-peptidoglycan transpeptidase YkuD (ErfK/YbiS/YcfS/YnhG family)